MAPGLIPLLSLVLAADPAAAVSRLSPGLVELARSRNAEFLVVQVWSPFCDACGEEVSELNLLARSSVVAVIGVPVMSRKREIQAFVDHFRPEYPQWEPDEEFRKEAARDGRFPRTLLLGRGQKIIKEWFGKVSAAAVLRQIGETQ